jgi:hypothetical protein
MSSTDPEASCSVIVGDADFVVGEIVKSSQYYYLVVSKSVNTGNPPQQIIKLAIVMSW